MRWSPRFETAAPSLGTTLVFLFVGSSSTVLIDRPHQSHAQAAELQILIPPGISIDLHRKLMEQRLPKPEQFVKHFVKDRLARPGPPLTHSPSQPVCRADLRAFVQISVPFVAARVLISGRPPVLQVASLARTGCGSSLHGCRGLDLSQPRSRSSCSSGHG